MFRREGGRKAQAQQSEEKQNHDEGNAGIERGSAVGFDGEDEGGEGEQGKGDGAVEALHAVLQALYTLALDGPAIVGVGAGSLAGTTVADVSGGAIGHSLFDRIRKDREEVLVPGALPNVAVGMIGETNGADGSGAAMGVAGHQLQ